MYVLLPKTYCVVRCRVLCPDMVLGGAFASHLQMPAEELNLPFVAAHEWKVKV